MVFYTDFCPYYYDMDVISDNNYFIDSLSERDMLQRFRVYYVSNCLWNNPYISIRNLINQFVEERTNNKGKRNVIANIIKMKLNESDFIEKNIDGIEVYVIPKNYKELEKAYRKFCTRGTRIIKHIRIRKTSITL